MPEKSIPDYFFDVIIIGGGAAGFFAAAQLKELNPKASIGILERGVEVMQKIKVSGGGRCNVTHACFEPKELVKYYPRGSKELLGAFYRFGPKHTIDWFENRGVKLKTETDGRVFPVSDNSQSIIHCLLQQTEQKGVSVQKGQTVKSITTTDSGWEIQTKTHLFKSQKLIIATGSNTQIWQLLSGLGHRVISPVPSLFTFNIKDPRIEGLAGISAKVAIAVENEKLRTSGALLITHWGMSGPAVLKLSAWGARSFFEKNYQFSIIVNWLEDTPFNECLETLKNLKQSQPKKTIGGKSSFDFPNRLWDHLVIAAKINLDIRWADLSRVQLQNLAEQLTQCRFEVNGKSTFKEEFVTAGGVDLKEIDCKTFESRMCKNLYIIGECLNIDAVTGGFNFQNAWTGAALAAQAICESAEFANK
jgi:predicted Rossmann fold flavoprotein